MINASVVLGVDQSSASTGVTCLAPDRRMLLMDIARNERQQFAVCVKARGIAKAMGLPLVVVLEDHALTGRGRGKARAERGQWSTAATLLGMGDARGGWRMLCALHGLRWIKVSPETWRPRVLGIPGKTKSDTAKQKAVDWASSMFGRNLLTSRHDAAESAAIAWWGLHSQEVKELANMRSRKAILDL